MVTMGRLAGLGAGLFAAALAACSSTTDGSESDDVQLVDTEQAILGSSGSGSFWIAPNPIPAGAPNTNVTAGIYGDTFTPTTTLTMRDLLTNTVSPLTITQRSTTELTFVMTAAQLANARRYSVTAADGATSITNQFVVRPNITTIDGSIYKNLASNNVTINGAGFISGTTVLQMKINAGAYQNIGATFVSANQLKYTAFRIFVESGTVSFRVLNSVNTGSVSNVVTVPIKDYDTSCSCKITWHSTPVCGNVNTDPNLTRDTVAETLNAKAGACYGSRDAGCVWTCTN